MRLELRILRHTRENTEAQRARAGEINKGRCHMMWLWVIAGEDMSRTVICYYATLCYGLVKAHMWR